MTKARKKFDSAFKAQSALEVLGEDATVPELARRHGVHQNQSKYPPAKLGALRCEPLKAA